MPTCYQLMPSNVCQIKVTMLDGALKTRFDSCPDFCTNNPRSDPHFCTSLFCSQCAALVGEDQPLCPDLPELDLSELDVSDLDADSFLGGLKWYSDQSEIISAQYGNEASNLFEVRNANSFFKSQHFVFLCRHYDLEVPWCRGTPLLHAY